MVIWNAEDVVSGDTSGNVDAQINTWATQQYLDKKLTMSEQNTDTHWFCSNQCQNWNFRIVWDNQVIDDDSNDSRHKLYYQLWDKNIIGSDTLIGDVEIDFTDLAKFCFQEDVRQSAIGSLDDNG